MKELIELYEKFIKANKREINQIKKAIKEVNPDLHHVLHIEINERHASIKEYENEINLIKKHKEKPLM